jgi:hypothetical protein
MVVWPVEKSLFLQKFSNSKIKITQKSVLKKMKFCKRYVENKFPHPSWILALF